MQLTHYNSKFDSCTFPITIVCENVSNAANLGSLFRTADAFGVEKLVICGTDIPMGRKMTKTSRATEKLVNFELHLEISPVLSQLKSDGYTIMALKITNSSQAIEHLKIVPDSKIALLIGDENFGISEVSLNSADQVVHITMFGQNSSMNVVQATSIALFEITKQLVQFK